MTQISTIYDRFITVVSSTLPGYDRIPFAYLLDKNPLYDKAWGIALGPASRDASDQNLGGGTRRRILSRTITIPLYNQAAFSLGDTVAINTSIKNLTEDFISLYKALETNSDLNGGSAIHTYYSDDSGIQFAELNRATVAAIIVNFDVTYGEAVS